MSLDYRACINRELPAFERGCASKAAFISRGEAGNLARHGRSADGRLHPYHCAHCGLWHLGHRRRHHEG